MSPDDRELEAFLRSFQPLPPPQLRSPPVRLRVSWRVTLAAAVLFAVWLSRPVHYGPPPLPAAPLRPTWGALNAVLRAGRYDAALDAMAPSVLPDPGRAGSALIFASDSERRTGGDFQ